MRREFLLPEEDNDYLEGYHSNWEAITVGPQRWLILENYPIPHGYNVKEVKLALRIDSGYPNSQIDMVYFFPHLRRLDNKPIGALANQIIENVGYQRWSRHRTPNNPWRPGIDNLHTHLMLIDYWLEREFILR